MKDQDGDGEETEEEIQGLEGMVAQKARCTGKLWFARLSVCLLFSPFITMEGVAGKEGKEGGETESTRRISC